MLSPFVHRETLRIQRQWTPAERKSRQQVGQRQRAKLAALVCRSSYQAPEVWAAGAMTAVDLQRVAS